MSWDYRFSSRAAKQFRRIPRDRQEQVRGILERTRVDPFAGDVVRIKSGHFEGYLRRRIGRYRLIFGRSPDEGIIEIADILPRSEKTYH